MGCYSFFIQAQAESLLRDLTALAVGTSTESDVEQLTRKYSRYVVSRESSDDVVTTTFTVRNRWFASLKLEPEAWFAASLSTKRGYVCHIGASLMRSMDTYPTFQASAGIVDEYAEYPPYFGPSGHFEFPTPIGKPYLRVRMDSHASPIQRRRAFNFSFTCLVKLGGGCDLPCDYLPLAWQDWKGDLQQRGFSDVFNQHYPNGSRCKQ